MVFHTIIKGYIKPWNGKFVQDVERRSKGNFKDDIYNDKMHGLRKGNTISLIFPKDAGTSSLHEEMNTNKHCADDW